MKVPIQPSIKFFFGAFLILLLSSCTTNVQRLSLKSDTGFSRNSSLVIKDFESDRSGFLDELTYRLIEKKFSVVSDRIIEDRFTISEQTEYEEGSVRKKTQVYEGEQIKGSYILETDFNYFNNAIQGRLLSDFSASIIDVKTGEIILTARIDKVLSQRDMSIEFVEMLMQEMYNQQ